MNGGEYGAHGVLGIGTPQSNPTVEPEIRTLLPDAVNLLATRLTSPVADSRDRLIDYLERLGDALDTYDRLALDAFGFACTGSSYLVGATREDEIVAAAEAGRVYPVITAARAVRAALEHLGARRIAVVSPYPVWLDDAAIAYWVASGFEVTSHGRIDTGDADTRGVYGMTSATAMKAATALDTGGADAILLAGTGMPTLAVIAALERRTGLPVVSSNLCLAWALAGVLEPPPPPRPAGTGETLLAGWADRLLARLS